MPDRTVLGAVLAAIVIFFDDPADLFAAQPRRTSGARMPYLVAAVIVLGLLCLVNLVLTLAVIRRLRVHTLRLAELGPATRAPLVQPGTRLGDFSATAVEGETVSRAFFSGPSVVAVFSTECASCHERLPEFTSYLAETRPERVLAVVTGDPGEAGRFTRELTAATVVLEPMGGPVSRALQVSQFPSFYLVDGDGVVVAADTAPGRLPAPTRG
ncbi:TlpA disulfide reductase family protein [Nonomuraea pusilla]|uniref:Peroxiredoxin n=1 Tax=Nonomuraea pusilla TaxID=46177 RepID=A0A1H7Q5C4_9ACTN|nr:TlpA disulfide reductase family protein [Nonomuraea pusilla]SEL43193.1 Peroxiredoxin [Nonomuraea pusilla]